MFFLKNILYRWILETKYSPYDSAHLFAIIEDYGKYSVIEATEDALTYTFNAEDDILAVRTKNDENRDIYYRNIHLHTSNMEQGHLTTIEIKCDSCMWEVPKKGNTYDFSAPLTETMEVYYDFDVLVLNRQQYNTYSYKNGTWDEYFHETMRSLESVINSYTIPVKFSNAYSKKTE